MGSIHISDFRFGMDRRRERKASVPGTLWLGENVHLSRGGDIERAKKLVPTYSLPANTFGLGIVRGQLFVFGSALSPAMPNGVQYQRLVAPDGAAMVQVLDAKTFDGKLYVVAKFATGDIYHFYNGVRVSQWDTVAAGQTDRATLVAAFAELVNNDPAVVALADATTITLRAQTPGVDFTLSALAVNAGAVADESIILTTVQPNVVAVPETLATGSVTVAAGSFNPGANRVVQVSVNGTPLMNAPVNWQISHASTAGAVAAQINDLTATHGYSAVAVGAVVTISAPPGTGVIPNGFVVASSASGDVILNATNMQGGVSAVAAMAKVVTAQFAGTFEAADQYYVTINGTSYFLTGRAAGTGTGIIVHKKRVWSPANSLLDYSKLLDPSNWTDAGPASGAGFLNVASETESNERLTGGASFGGSQLAIFARDAAYIYDISTDASQISIAQALPNTGARSGRAITPYGNLDLYYLDSTGIRSLRVQSLSGLGTMADVGGTIDAFVLAYVATLPESVPERAVATIGPEGRYMLAIGERIFVLSSFPGYKVSAWSYYSPGFEVTDFARTKDKLYARAANTIYLYGGDDGNTYPGAGELAATVQLPFVCNRDHASVGALAGFDMSCTNEWLVHALLDPNNEAAQVLIGRMTGSTYNKGHIKFPGVTSHVAFDLVCDKAGPATISNLTLYDDVIEAR